MARSVINYAVQPTAAKFHDDNSFIRGLLGPVGSGKSVACCVEGMKRSYEQLPNADGVRKSRGVIIRNTYRELQDTTMETWFDWFPKSHGKFVASDAKHYIYDKLPDGTTVQAEILFRALDRPDDVKKLLSLELTWAFVNEAREIPFSVINMLTARVGRYPSMREGGPRPYAGIFMDTNPPDTDHWWYRVFEEERPKTWKLFHQPSALSPEAENIPNLIPGYYSNIMAGKDPEWINVYVRGQYGFVQDGKVIYPEFNDQIHVGSELLTFNQDTVILGIDFGLTPATVFCQIDPTDGQFQVVDEIVTEDAGAVELGRLINKKLNNTEFRSAGYRDIGGDPAGEQRAQTDKRTPFDMLTAAGIHASPTHTNDPTIRRETVANLLTTLTSLGRPGLVISPRCKMLRKAMNGGYRYRRIQVTGDERYADKPDKNMYSHVAEALQYACLIAGLDQRIHKGSLSSDNFKVKTSIDRHKKLQSPKKRMPRIRRHA